MKTEKPYQLFLWTPQYGTLLKGRGRMIAEFSRYKDLVADAERRAKAAGYPKSRWPELFDWAKF